MSFLAMSPILNWKIHSAHCIYLPGSDFQMGWIYAPSISAKMVALKVIRNWSKKEFMRKTVSVFLAAVGYGISAISFSMTSRSPDPAAGTSLDGNLLSETRRQRVEVNC
jgi:hypothetical protein